MERITNRPFRSTNRPTLATGALLAFMGAVGLTRLLWLSAEFRSLGIPDSFRTFDLLVDLFVLGLGLGFSASERVIEIDRTASVVTVQMRLSMGARQLLVLSQRTVPLADITMVGLQFVFRGPARVLLLTRSGVLQAASYLLSNAKAEQAGERIAQELGVPCREVDWKGREKGKS